jgi:hypothetical protein
MEVQSQPYFFFFNVVDLDQPHGDTLSSPDHETTTSVPDTRKSDTEEDHIRKGRKKVV